MIEFVMGVEDFYPLPNSYTCAENFDVLKLLRLWSEVVEGGNEVQIETYVDGFLAEGGKQRLRGVRIEKVGRNNGTDLVTLWGTVDGNKFENFLPLSGNQRMMVQKHEDGQRSLVLVRESTHDSGEAKQTITRITKVV